MAMAEMEDVPLVSEEKIPSNRRRLMMVVGATTFLMAMTLSISLGYVYFHKQHFRIRAGDPLHTKVGFPNQKDVQKLLELLQECHAFRQCAWQVALFSSLFIFFIIPVISDTAQHVFACAGDLSGSPDCFQRAEVLERGQFGSGKHQIHTERLVP